MVLAGEASFAFYLFHVPLLVRLGLGPVERWYGFVFITTLEFSMILLVAVGAHVVIELPAQRWIRRTLDRRARVAHRVNGASRMFAEAATGTSDGASPDATPADSR